MRHEWIEPSHIFSTQPPCAAIICRLVGEWFFKLNSIAPMRKFALNAMAGFFFLLSLIIVQPHAAAQQGAEVIYKDIKKLGVLANVVYVAAHPDDENTRLISYLSNHLHVHTTYLSLTRGDGGQNLIGSQIREMLGLIRTHELLEARKIDHGNQLFTRAYDFGFSKTPDETLKIWDRDGVLSDVVWAIRKTRPDVIINRFTTETSRPNHGHHTASAVLSIEAFHKAADHTAYRNQLAHVKPWQPQRIFLNTSWWWYGSQEAFEKVDKSKMVTIDIGAFDPITGQSNSEIAGRSRSMHKSQGFGSAETRGESLEYLDLIEDVSGGFPKSLFEGIDITWNRVPDGAAIGKMVEQLEATYDFRNPAASVPQLIDIHRAISQLQDDFWRERKIAECEKLIKACLGLYIEARTDVYRTSPGSSLKVTIEVINRSPIEVSLLSATPSTPDSEFREITKLGFNKPFTRGLVLTTPYTLSIPYWLQEPFTEGMYTVSDIRLRGLPADLAPVNVYVTVMVSDVELTFTVPVIYKTVDPAQGEISRPLAVTPPVAVEAESDALVFTNGVERTIQFTLTAIERNSSGELVLVADNPEWKIEPQTFAFTFEKPGETGTFTCRITPPTTSSKTALRPEIRIGGEIYHHKVHTIDFPHLPYMSVVGDATTTLSSMDIKITPRPIAYIQGAGDEVPAALRQVGYQVDVIDPNAIQDALLNQYEVVILGVRAFNTVEALAYKNVQLMNWVDRGGTLIVQYNVNNGLVTTDLGPYPITLSRDRVTEENAVVRLLQPDHRIFHSPNKITKADFDGWVQERGLYFPSKWDARYIPLLEMADSGETPKHGALLVAEHGKGYYVYSGLSWFRHLPAGNTGAYRLLSNIIALGSRQTP